LDLLAGPYRDIRISADETRFPLEYDNICRLVCASCLDIVGAGL
jgi:hypothetical protein